MGGTFHTCCPTAHPPHARVDSECKRWNLEHVVLDLFSHITVGKVQDRWLFVSCRGSRSPNSPFSLSRLANLTHAVAARLSLSVTTWQHVYRRVRELDIEFEPTRHWTSSFFTACSYHGSSRRLATATRRVRLTLPENANSCSCASSTCALASESHQDCMWNPDETVVRLVPKKPSQPMSSPRAPSSRSHLLQTREAACGHRLSMKRRPIECTLMDHAFRASSCPTLRHTGSRRRLPWT